MRLAEQQVPCRCCPITMIMTRLTGRLTALAAGGRSLLDTFTTVSGLIPAGAPCKFYGMAKLGDVLLGSMGLPRKEPFRTTPAILDALCFTLKTLAVKMLTLCSQMQLPPLLTSSAGALSITLHWQSELSAEIVSCHA